MSDRSYRDGARRRVSSPARALVGSLVALAVLALLGAFAPGASAVSAISGDPEPIAGDDELAQWIAAKWAWYEAHPELAMEKGSGWKPLNRIRWFHEARRVDGELPPAGARMAAWERRRELESQGRVARGASPWFCLGPTNFAGRMLSLAFDPTRTSTVYAGSAGGGLWKSTDSGDTWAPITDDLPSLGIGGVAVSPNDPDVVVIGTGEATYNIDRIGGVGIWRSTDAGATWSPTNVTYAASSGHGFHFIEANPLTGTMLGGTTSGLWRSTDDGATWSQVEVAGNWYDAKWKPGDANVAYAVRGSTGNSSSGIFASTDDGATWSLAGTGQPPGSQIGKSKLAVTAADPDVVYAILVNGSTSSLLGVYRSGSSGATWTLQANTPNIPGGQGWYNLSLAADPDDATRLLAGGVQLYRSETSGTTWSTVGAAQNVHVDHHVALWEPGSTTRAWVGSDGGLWRSDSDGVGWIDRNEGLVTYQFYDICVAPNDPYVVFGGTQDNGTDQWPGSTIWTEGLGGDGMVCVISPNSSAAVYAETQNGGHYKTFNGGVTWSSIMTGITGSGRWVTPVGGDPNRGAHLFTETSAGIFRTTNGGLQWTNVTSQRARWISVSPVDDNVTWAVNNGAPLRTTDDGATWSTTATYGFATGTPTKVLAHPTDAAGAFVTFSGYSSLAHVARTTDGGTSWENVTGDLPNEPVNAIAVDPSDPDAWYVGTDIGVWQSTDGGTTWLPFELGLPNTVIDDLEIQDGGRKLRAGTHGRGAWEVTLPGADPTGVVPSIATGPNGLLLDPPFPNPVGDTAVLRFAARARGSATLDVYDVAGRRVASLGTFPADGLIRTAPWLTDDAPAGVYFAVLRAGAEKATRKLVVTR